MDGITQLNMTQRLMQGGLAPVRDGLQSRAALVAPFVALGVLAGVATMYYFKHLSETSAAAQLRTIESYPEGSVTTALKMQRQLQEATSRVETLTQQNAGLRRQVEEIDSQAEELIQDNERLLQKLRTVDLQAEALSQENDKLISERRTASPTKMVHLQKQMDKNRLELGELQAKFKITETYVRRLEQKLRDQMVGQVVTE